MEIARTIPAQNGLGFRTSRPSLACRRVSRLKPITKASASTQTLTIESTQTHLSNLEKLLQKQTSQPLQYKTETSHGDSGNESSPEQMFRNLFENLNLTKILPDMKAAEEISPRHMNHLQRLLSKSPEYSPRNNLGSRWREYHGCNDWGGLLDPLDENLRREIVKYGEFIQAAYQTFNSHPATSDDKAPLPREVVLPDKSYKVTKSLYATSAIGLPAWVDDMAPDLGWMTQRSSWIGYVAVCDDKKEISRMGRRDIVIALRGTATCLEWAENVRDILDPVPGEENSNRDQQAKVECGFLSLYKTPGSNMPSLAESVVEEVRRLKELYKGETLSITVTGHSLGAALALLAADELSTCAAEMPPIAVFSFGGPRVGNRAFTNQVTENGVKVLRIVNSQDIITKVPGVFVSEEIDQKLRENEKVAGVVNLLDNMPWAYSHVGTELRVDSKMSPYLKPNADVACCHDLEAYLHLVDGFMASDCPFRANAKRSLTRLLQEQRSNVKKLYISKAKDLSLRLNLDNLQGVGIPSCLPSPS